MVLGISPRPGSIYLSNDLHPISNEASTPKPKIGDIQQNDVTDSFSITGHSSQRAVLGGSTALKLPKAAFKPLQPQATQNNSFSALSTAEKYSAIANKAAQLNGGQQELISIILDKTKNFNKCSEAISHLLDNPNFSAAPDSLKMTILNQCAQNPNDKAIKTMNRLCNVSWFNEMSVSDQKRAAKTIGLMNSTAANANHPLQKSVLNNSLEKLLSGQIPLAFFTEKDVDCDPNSFICGFARPDAPGIFLNPQLVGDDSSSAPNKLIISTIAHEISHKINNDENQPSYQYFQAEYRAWYVGYVAMNGSEPTNQEAFDQVYNLMHNSAYLSISYAFLFNQDESQKITTFAEKILDQEIDNNNFGDRLNLFKLSVKHGNRKAPRPDPELHPILDNR